MAEQLELEATIGFGGTVHDGLICHPNKEHLVYPLGTAVIVERIGGKRTQDFLQGHTDTVSCVAVSHDGSLIASGQFTAQGYQTEIIVWDFKSMQEKYRLKLHKGEIAALSFSPSDKYLLSLGGEDDGTAVIWNMASGEAVCGSPTATSSSGAATTAAFSSCDDAVFITAGIFTLRVWQINFNTRKLTCTDVQLRTLRRKFTTIVVDKDDENVYVGTDSGDIIHFNLRTKLLKGSGPAKKAFAHGVHSMKFLDNGHLLVGGGAGTVSVINPATWRATKTAELTGLITSVAPRGGGHEFYVGTSLSCIYRFGFSEFREELRTVCHPHRINDIEFPRGTSDLFATCSINDIRVWVTESQKEVVRITVPNKECLTVIFEPNGKSIISGWDDGVIRAFYPESGKLKYQIVNAHNKGVTALGVTDDCSRLISGGGDGQVRVWQLGPATQTLVDTFKEHKGKVTDIKVRSDDTECISSSTDGSCIVWNLDRSLRSQILTAKTNFTQVCYHPDEAQAITVGSDRRVSYWELLDGALIREISVASSGAVTAMDITYDGDDFAVGGTDKLVKLFRYDEGEVTHVGVGHSGEVTRLKICPNNRFIITGSSDGAIFRWSFPQ